MSRTNFEKLNVYLLSEKLADTVWDIADNWSKFAKDTVGIQICRSADSIGANIAEGAGRVATRIINDSYGLQEVL
jgi:four helix bundle protein